MVNRTIFLILILCTASIILYADAVTYTYDDAGRLTAVNYPNGASISYSYDAAGNLTARTVTAANASAKKPDPKAKPAPAGNSEKQTGKTTRRQSGDSPNRTTVN